MCIYIGLTQSILRNIKMKNSRSKSLLLFIFMDDSEGNTGVSFEDYDIEIIGFRQNKLGFDKKLRILYRIG